MALANIAATYYILVASRWVDLDRSGSKLSLILPFALFKDVNLDFNCNFEQDICGWRQFTDDGSNWILERGSTSTVRTGPHIDHTFGSKLVAV